MALYVIFALLVVLGAAPGEQELAAVFVTLVPSAVLVAGRISLRFRLRRRLARPDVEPIAAAALGETLARAGVRRLTVVAIPPGGILSPRGAARAYRTGPLGTIMLNPTLKRADPDLVRFIVAHEASHLAHNDSLVSSLIIASLAGLIEGCVITPTAALLLIPAIGGLVAANWLRELTCDRFAAAATNARSARAFAAYLDRVDAHLRGHRLARVRALLTHPPAATRRGALGRAGDGRAFSVGAG